MLAQSFKSAADLGITEPQKEALMKTLVLLETDGIKHQPKTGRRLASRGEFTGHFNMNAWNLPDECGTAACIGGTAELVGDVKFETRRRGNPASLADLFWPYAVDPAGDWSWITPAQAATALRSYLATGDAKWVEAVAR